VLETGGGQREADQDVLETGGRADGTGGDATATIDQAAATVDQATASVEEAIATAYRYLNRRERTQAEMRAHLDRMGVGPRAVEQAIAALVQDGQLDDRRFARLFIQDKRELEGWGSDRIRQALLARGVEADVIDGALSEADGGDELERALELLRRRFPSPPHDRRERDRALGVLLRKGYDAELALDAIAAHARAADG
jgi:regulatory protein